VLGQDLNLDTVVQANELVGQPTTNPGEVST
jgi:hypothetical protein